MCAHKQKYLGVPCQQQQAGKCLICPPADTHCACLLLPLSPLLLLLLHRNTPGLLSTAGLLSAIGAAALVYLIPDDNTGLVAAQVAGASALGAGAIAALVGSSILSNLQKV